MRHHTDLNLRHSAFHEAGHVAVAIHLGCIVREVHVYDARRSYEGDTRFDISSSVTKCTADRKACVVGFSGIAAALKHDPKRDPRARGDRERVNVLLHTFPTSVRPTLYQEFESEAVELVRLLWPWVCAFAKAIESTSLDSIGRRSLSQEEVAEIYSATTEYGNSNYPDLIQQLAR